MKPNRSTSGSLSARWVGSGGSARGPTMDGRKSRAVSEVYARDRYSVGGLDVAGKMDSRGTDAFLRTAGWDGVVLLWPGWEESAGLVLLRRVRSARAVGRRCCCWR